MNILGMHGPEGTEFGIVTVVTDMGSFAFDAAVSPDGVATARGPKAYLDQSWASSELDSTASPEVRMQNATRLAFDKWTSEELESV